jgi:hypothetical protein
MKLSKIKINKLTNPNTALSILLQVSIIVLSFAYSFFYPQTARATLTTSYIRFDRQSQTQTLAGTVCMQDTANTPSVAKVTIAFPSSFVVSGANTSWSDDTTATNIPTGSTAWPVTGASLTVDSATTAATFLVGDLTSNANTYCFHFTSNATGSTTGSSGNNLLGSVILYKSNINSSTVVETMNYATAITSGANSEQIGVTASVSASFSFALSGGATGQTLPLGALNSATTVTTPYRVTATISTNAHNGFLAWVKGLNADGLHSTTAGGTGITSPASYPTVSDLASTTGYGIFGVTGTNAPTIAAGYNTGDAGTQVGFVDSTQFQQLASKTGQQSGTTFTIGARAKPLATQTAANDYADTLTVVASGSF